jgi:hypothetical protein
LSGLSEILLILLIVVVLFFLPRMVSRSAPPPVRRPPRQPFMKKITGRWRLAILVSVVWLAAAALWFKPWMGSPTQFVVIGAAPVVVGWGLVWVMAGFRKRR